MISQGYTSAIVALAAASLAAAQTSTSCNPTQKQCPPDPAFGGAASCDWTSGACDLFAELPGTTLTYNSDGAVFTINTEAEAPTIRTNKYLFFGRVDVEVQAAPGDGIVTSAVLQSDDLDELDWEWVGSDNAHGQSDWFYQGETGTFNRGGFHAVSNPLGSVHTYSWIWTSSSVQWLIDDSVVRTLTYAEAVSNSGFPQSPMQVKLGTWVGGCSTCAPGTVTWAGGHVNMADAPFIAYYKSIAITDYAGGSSAPDGAIKEYIYKGTSGSWQSIEVVKGDGSSSKPSKAAHSSSSTTSSTSTKAPKSKEPKTSSTTSSTSSTTKSKAKKTTTSTTSSKAVPTTTMAKHTTVVANTSSHAAPPATHTSKSASSHTGAPATETSSTKGAATRGSVAIGSLIVAAVLATLF